ncbi:MAG: T9SS type A sorting domain-containing protein [Bacteroidales bacterium]|nr:T9SS type A sorting domain-containing protein [Bacteroidales bacterium]
MKKICLIIILLMTATTMWSQYDNTVMQPDSMSFKLWTRNIENEWVVYDGSGSMSYNDRGALDNISYSIVYHNEYDDDEQSCYYYFYYDNYNNLIEYRQNYYGNAWPIAYRYEISRADELIVDVQQELYYPSNDEWRLTDKCVAYYDDNDRIVEDSVFKTGGEHTGAPYLCWNNIYEYFDNQIIRTYYVIDSPYSSDYSKRITTTLTSEGKIQSVTMEEMTDNVFANKEYEYYHYENGVLSNIESFRWDGEWIPYGKDLFTRNDDGDVVMVEHKLWNTDDYQNYKRTISEYNEEGYPLSIQFQDFSDADNMWVEGTSHSINRYNSMLSRQWVTDKFFTQEHLQIQDIILRNSKVYFSRIDFSYIETINPHYFAEETEDMPITVHPNPTNGLVNITGDAISYIEVVNILGQSVLKKYCDSDNVTIDLSGQPAGLYLFEMIYSNGKKYVRKVVRE